MGDLVERYYYPYGGRRYGYSRWNGWVRLGFSLQLVKIMADELVLQQGRWVLLGVVIFVFLLGFFLFAYVAFFIDCKFQDPLTFVTDVYLPAAEERLAVSLSWAQDGPRRVETSSINSRCSTTLDNTNLLQAISRSPEESRRRITMLRSIVRLHRMDRKLCSRARTNHRRLHRQLQLGGDERTE